MRVEGRQFYIWGHAFYSSHRMHAHVRQSIGLASIYIFKKYNMETLMLHSQKVSQRLYTAGVVYLLNVVVCVQGQRHCWQVKGSVAAVVVHVVKGGPYRTVVRQLFIALFPASFCFV